MHSYSPGVRPQLGSILDSTGVSSEVNAVRIMSTSNDVYAGVNTDGTFRLTGTLRLIKYIIDGKYKGYETSDGL